MSKLNFRNFYNILYALVRILMHFTGAKFLQNDLKETGDMTISSSIYACKHVHNRTIIHPMR